MLPLWTDSIVMYCSSVEVAKRWWVEKLDCKQVKLPNWDNPLPSDVALLLPGAEEPSILLTDRAEVKNAGFPVPTTVPILFTNKLKKVQEYLAAKSVPVGPIQDGGDTEFFEIRDPDGNVIEICKEP